MDRMTAAGLQEEFGITPEQWTEVTGHPDFPEPVDPKYTDGRIVWPSASFARWLAQHRPDLTSRAPVLLRHAPAGRVTYLGGTFHKDEPRATFVAQWRTPLGGVAIAYPQHDLPRFPELTAAAPEAAVLVRVWHDYNLNDGPNLDAVDAAHPDRTYVPGWTDLESHLGGPVPWWPSTLRRPEHLEAWRPDGDVQAVEVVTWPDWEPLFALAADAEPGSAPELAALHTGHAIRDVGIAGAQRDAEYYLEQCAHRSSIVVPAVPGTTGKGDAPDVPEDVLRAGWAELLQRTDELAAECVRQKMMWDGGSDFPFGAAFIVTDDKRTTAEACEWMARLVPGQANLALTAWGSDKLVRTLCDPVTGFPVALMRGYYRARPHEYSYHSFAPKSLPAGRGGVKHLVLDDPVWIRTGDGTLYPAPEVSGTGHSWGYSGGGPAALATLIAELLEDAAAPAITRYGQDLPPGIEALTRKKWKRGKRFRRRALERARDGRPLRWWH